VLAIGRNDGGLPAGHGLFGIAFAKNNPQAEIVALDWAPVLEVAKENARNAEGSAFDVDYGSGYDLVLLTNFLHHFDMATCEALLRKIRAALADGGRALTLELCRTRIASRRRRLRGLA
jgi:2-polyprenyl-3-methyl-5-hydroxy-6-metoxy-1,4-benzoquinol methylase